MRRLPGLAFPRAIAWMGVSAAIAGCTLGPRMPAEQACTLAGCGPSLEVALIGEHVPTDFSVTVQALTGERVNVHCTEGNADFTPPGADRWTPTCPVGGVTFYDFMPAAMTVTVRWSEGEVAQEFQPVYNPYEPNGARCEPTCRSARLEVLIPEYPRFGEPSTWEIYTDEAHGFRIRYPPQLPLEQGPTTEGSSVVYVGEQIQIETSLTDPLVCLGECPMIESVEFVTIAQREARRARGYIGSVGGNVPQYFVRYVFRLGPEYASFVLFAESRHARLTDPSIIRQLAQQDIELFERMMQTLEIPFQGP